MIAITAAAGALLLRALGATWRIDREGEERLAAARGSTPRGNVIYAFWHSSLLVLACTHRHRDIQVLVSQHRDGELIARILARMGYGLVRGSSRRGGAEALFRLATLLEQGKDVAVTVDGPVGPRYAVHPGVVLLARRTGRPIVPVVPTYERGTMLRTWDALRVPRPGTRVRVQHGEPFPVPPSGAPGAMGHHQRDLERRLRDLTSAEEARWGRTILLEDIQDLRSYWERASEGSEPNVLLRALARGHGVAVAAARRLRPRRRGAGGRPWVLGVGNLEAGGTGKTPVVVLLASTLAAQGVRTAVLTRGHRGALGGVARRVGEQDLPQASDETRLLYAALGKDVAVWVARDKPAGLGAIRALGGVDAVLVDDAFQTAGLPVDRHLVLLDWERPLGNGCLLPAGRLREGPDALRRADALLFTRARSDAAPSHPAWEHLAGTCFVAHERAGGFWTPAGAPVAPESLRGVGVALLSGLGRPAAFEALARAAAVRAGFRVRRAVRVGDHAPLEPALRKLVGRLAALECRHVVTTQKDVLRLPPGTRWEEPLLVLEQRLHVPALDRLLEALLPDYCWSAKLAKVTDSEAGM